MDNKDVLKFDFLINNEPVKAINISFYSTISYGYVFSSKVSKKELQRLINIIEKEETEEKIYNSILIDLASHGVMLDPFQKKLLRNEIIVKQKEEVLSKKALRYKEPFSFY